MKNATILFFDDSCALCQFWVRFVLRLDKEGKVYFAPLFGETFDKRFSKAEVESSPDSVIVSSRNGVTLSKSDAIIEVLKVLGGIWKVIGSGLAVVPTPLRDFLYDCVAKIRRFLFSVDSPLCPLLSKSEQLQFLP